MPTLDGSAAIAWMRAKRTNVPGSCLNTCWQAYGSHDSIGPHAGQYPNAINGWQYATRRHPGDLNPPAGVPVYFDALPRPRYAGDTNYAAGDVVISVGGGRVICTDGAGAGLIAEMTIQQRASRIGRVYLGWCEDFLGYDVAYAGATPASTTVTDLDLAALIPKENTMAVVFLRKATKEIGVFGADFAEPDGTKRGRHIAKSMSDYNGFKAALDAAIAKGGKGIPELPVIVNEESIVGLDENGWGVVCRFYGV